VNAYEVKSRHGVIIVSEQCGRGVRPTRYAPARL